MHAPHPHGQDFHPTWLTTEYFDLDVDGRHVPGVSWRPTEGAPTGIVLIGHGASGTKTEGYVVALARRLVRRGGFLVAAIDGPVHGHRRSDPTAAGVVPFLEFSQRWANDEALTDQMVADWRATLDWLEATHGGGRPVGYWGVSMGTILGLPFVAAEPRVSAAVLGLMGKVGPTEDRLVHDARRLTCPVQFLIQLEDQLFHRSTTLALFDEIGTDDKHVLASPGAHGDVPTRAFVASAAFLAAELGASRPDDA